MKKLLGILLISLLWCSISFAHKENINSIENCADRKTWHKLSKYTGYSKKDAGIIFRDMGIKNKEAVHNVAVMEAIVKSSNRKKMIYIK